MIREIHAHNEEKRDTLRRTHTDAYQEFEKVHAELDALTAELNTLTDKEIALDANFSRYGYSAHIRMLSMLAKLSLTGNMAEECIRYPRSGLVGNFNPIAARPGS